MRGWRRVRPVLAAAIASSAMATPAAAHAFGARYDLPLPLWLYLSGAGAAVALTFALLALFARQARGRSYSVSFTLPVVSGPAASQALGMIVKALSVFLFVLVLATGLFGQQNTIHNLAPTFVWVIWWVGLAFAAALVADPWPVLNPWTAIHDGGRQIAKMAGAREKARPPLKYPAALGVWPSVLLFGAFVWLELVSSAGEQPRTLACLILAYSTLTWAGMTAFGRNAWLRSGEAFHQVFGILGRFAPIAAKDGKAILRPYGAGLLTAEPVHVSMTAFVILLLSAVTFDGFVETPVWAGFLDWLSTSKALRPALLWLQDAGIDLLRATKTAALFIFPCVFLAVFLCFCGLSRALAGGGVSTWRLANTLVLSLVPIAIAYHVSHYLSYLLLAGQLIIPLASDPFGWGWDLFGTAGRAMDIGIINAEAVWYVAVTAIVLGHVIAVWLTHEMALALYRDARKATLSQVPMMVLMVLYTMTSLWILSQPIVES